MITEYADFVVSAAAGIALSMLLVKYGAGKSKVKIKCEEDNEGSDFPIGNRIKNTDVDIDSDNVSNLPREEHFGNEDNWDTIRNVEKNENCGNQEFEQRKCSDQLYLLNEDKVLKSTLRLRKVLGMSEEQIREAVQLTNTEIAEGKIPQSFHDEISWFKIFDILMFVSLLIVLGLFLNVATRGEFGRVLVGFFPKEFESLKLKDYLQRYQWINELSNKK